MNKHRDALLGSLKGNGFFVDPDAWPDLIRSGHDTVDERFCMCNKVWVGKQIKCFDPRLYVDDVKTPLKTTMQPAEIIGFDSDGHNILDGRHVLVTVQFKRDGFVSKGHFIRAIEDL